MMEKSPHEFQPLCRNTLQATNDVMAHKGKTAEAKENKVNGGRNNGPFRPYSQQFQK